MERVNSQACDARAQFWVGEFHTARELERELWANTYTIQTYDF
jgi:hypothetical protein